MKGVNIFRVWVSPVVSAVLWAAALAGIVWMLVPAIAFALRIGGVRTTILPDVGPPALQGDGGAFEPWSTRLAALGFRHAGRTQASARFMSPAQWRWRSVHPTRWLISPDGRTYVTMYRIVPNEPVRISAVTAFEGGGTVRTACPGPAPQEGLPPDHRWTSVRGVDADALLSRHHEQVAAFENERRATIKRATIAEMSAIDDAISLRLVRKSAAVHYLLVFVFLAAAALPLMSLAQGTDSASVALQLCCLVGAYALVGWATRGPLLRYFARLSLT